MQKYTTEMIAFMAENYPKAAISSWINEFNSTFNMNSSVTQVLAICRRNGIKSGRNGQFEQGHKPLRKSHSMRGKAFETAFGGSRSNAAQNTKPLGSKRIDRHGHLQVKVRQPNVWQRCKNIIWEKAYGKIPQDCVVRLFDDSPQAKANPKLDNLFLVSRAEMMRLNVSNFSDVPIEYKKAAVFVAKLDQKVKELSET